MNAEGGILPWIAYAYMLTAGAGFDPAGLDQPVFRTIQPEVVDKAFGCCGDDGLGQGTAKVRIPGRGFRWGLSRES